MTQSTNKCKRFKTQSWLQQMQKLIMPEQLLCFLAVVDLMGYRMLNKDLKVNIYKQSALRHLECLSLTNCH